ncbi:MAG: hypothetical protein LBP67_04655 [Bacteroidales bacterium]|jgi:hypothetical protein|nr:hypothetical protein [Bacteroidales bacterium]
MKKIIYLAVFSFISLTSCAPAYFKDAKHFVKTNGDNLAVMFVSPGNNIVYTNHKPLEIKGFDTLSVSEKEIVLKENSDFLSQLDNSNVYELFINKFLVYFTKTGLNVYTQEFEEEFNKNENKLIIDIAQVEFDEYYDMVRDEKEYFGKLYHNETYINAFAINIWIDYIKNNNTKLLFATNRITDYHLGWFETGYYEGDIYYYEDNIEMKFEHIEYFLDHVAKRYAEYLYDYIMTDYVYQMQTISNTNVPDSITLHHSSGNNRIFIIGDDYKFIEIE